MWDMTRRARDRSLAPYTVLLGDRLPVGCADGGAGGLSLQTAGVFLPGARVHGTVLVRAQRFPFKGEVVWARSGNLGKRELSRCGIRFLSVPVELSRALAAAPESRRRPNPVRVRRRPGRV